MDNIESILRQLPPETVRQSGRLATLVLRDGTRESFYYLGKHSGCHIVSREPYVAAKNFRDIELIRAGAVVQILFSAGEKETEEA